eukprot:1191205-Prorocentrum_minimum.AAC.1
MSMSWGAVALTTGTTSDSGRHFVVDCGCHVCVPWNVPRGDGEGSKGEGEGEGSKGEGEESKGEEKGSKGEGKGSKGEGEGIKGEEKGSKVHIECAVWVDFSTKDEMKAAIRKLDDSEFKNPFDRAYIRVKVDSGGSRDRRRCGSNNKQTRKLSVI